MILKLNNDLIEFLDSVKGERSRVSFIVSILQDYKTDYTNGHKINASLTNKGKHEHITIRNSGTILKD